MRNYSFRHPVEGRLAFERHVSCHYSNKACEFIASTVCKVHSLAKSKALAVLEKSQKYLANNSKYSAHILDRIQDIIPYLLSFRIRCAVVSNTFSSPIPCLNSNVVRTYSDGSWSIGELDELREEKCFNSGRHWLDERLETHLVCVSHLHG